MDMGLLSFSYFVDSTPWAQQATPEGFHNASVQFERCKDIALQIIERNRVERDPEPNVCLVVLRSDPAFQRLVDLEPRRRYSGATFSEKQLRDMAGVAAEGFLISGKWRFCSYAEKRQYNKDQERERSGVENARRNERRAALVDAVAEGLGSK